MAGPIRIQQKHLDAAIEVLAKLIARTPTLQPFAIAVPRNQPWAVAWVEDKLLLGEVILHPGEGLSPGEFLETADEYDMQHLGPAAQARLTWGIHRSEDQWAAARGFFGARGDT